MTQAPTGYAQPLPVASHAPAESPQELVDGALSLSSKAIHARSMTTDDPRHGTTRGYYAGCHEACCRAAMARYEKAGRLARLRGGRAVPALGAQRRIQALMALGWSSTDIAHAAGWGNRNYVLRILHGQKGRPCRWLERATHEAICAVYERLSMRLPDMTAPRARTRSHAARKGYLPPLCWDNPDDPTEQPNSTRPEHVTSDDVDEAVVQRVLDGERLDTTRAEKDEIARRWRVRGRPLADLERLTGWKVERYGRGAA